MVSPNWCLGIRGLCGGGGGFKEASSLFPLKTASLSTLKKIDHVLSSASASSSRKPRPLFFGIPSLWKLIYDELFAVNMKAIRIEKFVKVSLHKNYSVNLQQIDSKKEYHEIEISEVDKPQVKDREVLVQVAAAGVNFVDLLYVSDAAS